MKKILFGIVLTAMLVGCQKPIDHLVILHTNDTHSQVEPNGKDRGGYARRLGFINLQRDSFPDLLLLDAGDFSQGTPYFNFFHGRIEVDAMNRMGYDAATLGNHEFDNGMDTLAMLLRMAKFPVVCANYDFGNSVLAELIKPYVVIKRGGLRIGIYGITVDPKSLIQESHLYPLVWLEPYSTAVAVERQLHEKEHCDVIICLSHQGTYPMNGGSKNDVEMAGLLHYTDAILGGHTHEVHTLYVPNADGKEIVVAQMGKSGAQVGRVDLFLAN